MSNNTEQRALSVSSMEPDFDTTNESVDNIIPLGENSTEKSVNTQEDILAPVVTSEEPEGFVVNQNADKLLNSPKTKVPEESQYFDWFKNELAGNTENFADLLQDGGTPDKFKIKSLEEYWQEDKLREPFVAQYGEEEGKKKFEETLKISMQRLDAYKNLEFDVAATTERRYLPTQKNLAYEKLGLLTTYNQTSFKAARDIPPQITAESRKIKYGMIGNPEHSIRAGADDNGVMINGELISLDKYREEYDEPLVYAKNLKGEYLFENGKNYLRPLKENERKAAYEEYYTRLSDYMGLNDLEAGSEYFWKGKFLPQNIGNFAYSTINAGIEMYKSGEDIFLNGEENTDFYNGLVNLDNTLGKYLHVSSTDETERKWYTPEGITSGLIQAAGQIMLAYATGGGSAVLAAKLGATPIQAAKYANIASRIMMSAIAAPGLKEQARANGLSEREAASIHALSFMGYYYITNMTTFMFEENPAVQKWAANEALKRGFVNAGKIKQKFGKLTVAAQNQIAKNINTNLKSIIGKIKSGIIKLPEGLSKVSEGIGKMANFSPTAAGRTIGAGLIEAGEETSEAIMEASIKYTFDNVYKPMAQEVGIVDQTDPNFDSRFNSTWANLAQDIISGASIGFAAGGMSKRFFMRGNTPESQPGYYKMIAQGKLPMLESQAVKLYKRGAFDNKYINAEGKPVQEGEKSRNDIAYEAVKRDLEVAKAVWESHKLNNVYSKTEEKLAFLNNDALKRTSIGKDISEALTIIDSLTEENMRLQEASETDNTTQIEQNNKDIIIAKNNIEAIREGKWAGKYYHEIMYNMHGTPELNFDTYYKLNTNLKSKLATTQTNLVKAKELTNVEELTKNSIVHPENAEQLINQLESKYPDVPVDEDIPEMGMMKSPEIAEKINWINEGIEKYKALKTQNPLDILLTGFNSTDFKSTTPFAESISNFVDELELAETTGNTIFDNVEALSDLQSQIQDRSSQLDGMIISNEATNEGLKKINQKANEVVPTLEDYKKYKQELILAESIVDDMLTVARHNRADFEQALNKASNLQINNLQQRQSESIEMLRELSDFDTDNLITSLQANLVEFAATDDFVKKEQFLIQNEKEIHDFFSATKQATLDGLYKIARIGENGSRSDNVDFSSELGIGFGGKRVNYLGKSIPKSSTYPSTLRYLKTIITGDPAIFYKRYQTVLGSLPTSKSEDIKYTKSRHVPSTAQRPIINQLVSFVGDTTIPANTGFDSELAVINTTEGIFLTSYQGTGKTLVSSWAAKIDQMNRGGKVLVLANDNTNKETMQDTMKGLGVNLANSANITTNNLITHLGTDAQTDINLIVIDEATLMHADLVAKLDLTIREINKGRKGAKLKIIYTGDSMQIGATSSNGKQLNIARADVITSASTDEMTFSFRSGNDQINNLLEFLRKKFNPKHATDTLTTKYKRENNILSGVEIYEDEDFDKAMDEVMEKLGTDDDFIIITDDAKHSVYKSKYNLKDNQILSPNQAQGKQWKKVIIDIDTTTKHQQELDTHIRKTLLSTVGRAKEYVLLRIDNSKYKERTHGLYSVKGEPVNAETSITEDMRLRALERERVMTNGLSFNSIEDNTNSGTINEKVEVTPIHAQEVIESIENTPLTPDQKSIMHSIINKIEAKFNKAYAKVPQSERFFITFSYYSTGQEINEDSIESITDKGKLLELKRKLLYPKQGEENPLTNLSFELQIHDGTRPSIIQTQSKTKGKSADISDTDRRFVIYANFETEGKKYKTAVSVFTHPEQFGLSQSDLFDVTIPFTKDQSEHFLQTLRTGNSDNASTPAVVQREINLRQFDKGMKSMPISEFLKVNSNFWNFAPTLWVRTEIDEDGPKERQTYLLYSPTKSGEDIQKEVKEHPELMGDDIAAAKLDIFKLEVNGALKTETNDGFELIKKYYTTKGVVKNTDLPKFNDKIKTKVFNFFTDEAGFSKGKTEATWSKLNSEKQYSYIASTWYNEVYKAAKTGKNSKKTARERVLYTALAFGYYHYTKYKGKSYSQDYLDFVKKTQGVRADQTLREKGKRKNKKTGKTLTVFEVINADGKVARTITDIAPKFKKGEFDFDVRRVIGKLSEIVNNDSDSSEGRAAADILAELKTHVFPKGIFEKTPIQKNSTRGGVTDNYAPSTITIDGEDANKFEVRDMENPSMPKYNIAFDFVKDVLSQNEAYETKITTSTKYISEEKQKEVKKQEMPNTMVAGTKIENGKIPYNSISELVIPKEREDGSENNQWTAFEKANEKTVKSDLQGIYKKYFNFKPFGENYPKFLEEFRNRIYGAIYSLETVEGQESG